MRCGQLSEAPNAGSETHPFRGAAERAWHITLLAFVQTQMTGELVNDISIYQLSQRQQFLHLHYARQAHHSVNTESCCYLVIRNQLYME